MLCHFDFFVSSKLAQRVLLPKFAIGMVRLIRNSEGKLLV